MTGFGRWATEVGAIAVATMSEEQLKAFQEAVKADAGLQEKLKAAGGDADAVVSIAKATGFVISADEFQRALAEIPESERKVVTGDFELGGRSEITDEELESVAGGFKVGGDSTGTNNPNHTMC